MTTVQDPWESIGDLWLPQSEVSWHKYPTASLHRAGRSAQMQRKTVALTISKS